MKIKKLQHALLAAEIHGVDSDPDHEVGDLQDMLRIVFKLLPPKRKEQALKKLQKYVDKTCGVKDYKNDYDPSDDINRIVRTGEHRVSD